MHEPSKNDLYKNPHLMLSTIDLLTYEPQTPYTRSLRTHICEHCGNHHPVYPKDLERGKGVFCCLSCAAFHRTSTKYTHICDTCKIRFNSLDPSKKFCSIECEGE